MTAAEIRQAYLTFFENKSHHIVPSAPIVVKDDPTLMFTNAGMNQFKSVFLGEQSPKFNRVADTQRCLRVSGKHNDLEEVGIDTYHHTMFEMLGNWSFGDYFKKEAIAWSWELLTEVYKIPKDQLYVSVFKGDESEGLETDHESLEIWKQFIAEDRIILGNKKDNFWEMGETGPCGPCTEIHVDCRSASERSQLNGKELVNADHPQVIEIWNNVFMQFNRLKDGSLQSLPAKHVDTGMGFERLVRVLQQKSSNYDTDIFQPSIQFISRECGKPYRSSAAPGEEGWREAVAMRVMSDHIRAIAFVIADGQLPSNNKAGYVIRRILRRAVRYAYTNLELREPTLHKLVPLLAEQFKGVFSGLYDQRDFVQKVVQEEEAAFLRTLAAGLSRFDRYVPEGNVIDGNFAFELSDTFGFPLDLTELMAKEKGLSVDLETYESALKKQKSDSRAATTISTDDWVVVSPGDETSFVGYDELECETEILKYRRIVSKGKSQYQIVLKETPFYAESGGQVGDRGRLEDHSRQIWVDITDTKKENGLIVHFADTLPADLAGKFWAVVDGTTRRATVNNHSATHLLHAALKNVLGSHVNQKGSLVNPEYLRFDFSHFAKVTPEQLQEIEHIVNAKIRENIPLVEARNVPYNEAINSGVTALFGEKYGDFVRVITFGAHFSKELCGGTHAQSTGEIGYFKIISESAVAAGVRRIEAITAERAANFIDDQLKELQTIKSLFKGSKDPVETIQQLLQENQQLKKLTEKAIQAKAGDLKSELIEQVKEIDGIHFIAAQVDLQNNDAVKNLAFSIKDAVQDLVLVLTYVIDGKPGITVMISDSVVASKNVNAAQMVRELGKIIQGGGGGQPFYATAGGKRTESISEVLNAAEEMLTQILIKT